MFTEKNLLNRLRSKLKGVGAITLSSVLSNAIIMEAGCKGGKIKLSNSF